MRYATRLHGEFSELFASDVGLMTGDTGSPGFFLVYFADFETPPDDDDIRLAGVPISHLEQADDQALFSTTPAGLQRKLDALRRWCARNGIAINVVKTKCALFGRLPAEIILPRFEVGSRPLPWTEEYCYVGTTFTSTHRNIFNTHYTNKATKARQIAGSLISLAAYTGPIRPDIGRRLYMARVDPHLVFGCEAMPDADDAVKGMEHAQRTFLRRLLGLNPRSVVCVLFTETGIMPLRYRRAEIVLRYLAYIAALPPNHYAHIALLDTLELAQANKPGWLVDVLWSWRKLDKPLIMDVPELVEFIRNSSFDALITRLHDLAKASATVVINNAPKLELISGRRERNRDGQLVIAEVYRLRDYLLVPIATHRMALTRLLLSDHILAVEQMRRAVRGQRRGVPHDQRICRFCRETHVEDVLHALFVCTSSPELVQARSSFTTSLEEKVEGITGWHEGNPLGLLHEILSRRRVVALLARYAFEVTRIFELEPLFVAAAHAS
jgi:hypothetical protein